MAIFSVNSGDANKAFTEICKGLEKLAANTTTGGATDKRLTGDKGAKAGIYGTDRTPWVMTTTEWLIGPTPRALVWDANPSDVTWTMAQRSMHTKNLFGTVLHVWPNTERNTFYDEFRLHMNFQSGSIMPVFIPTLDFDKPEKNANDRREISGEYVPSGGLANFYDFMQLVDCPKLTAGTEGQPARANLVTIQYNSNLFPELTLTGMFDSNGISFTDSSQEPNKVSGWSADFIVYDSMPRLSANANVGQQTNLALMEIWKTMKIEKAALPNKAKGASEAASIDRASDRALRAFPRPSNRGPIGEA